MTSSIYELPEDNFGLFVENDTDRRKLLWLLEVIGEKKLRASAAKRNKYYPDSPLFVSVILKRFNLKPPLSVYARISVEIIRLYILASKDRKSLKIGITNRWPDRVYDFVKSANYSLNFDPEVLTLFDTELSMAFDCISETDARQTERNIKNVYKNFRVTPPAGIRNGKCPTEWFAFEIYDELLAIASQNRPSHSLKQSLTWSEIELAVNRINNNLQ